MISAVSNEMPSAALPLSSIAIQLEIDHGGRQSHCRPSDSSAEEPEQPRKTREYGLITSTVARNLRSGELEDHGSNATKLSFRQPHAIDSTTRPE
jgi:hypothetical protein